MSEKNMWQIEEKYYAQDIRLICGVDEAGRGPLAGPVCAAAVILPANIEIPGLDDSKKLSDKRRRELFPVIQEKAIAFAVAFADHKEIDEINILQATFLAMERAIKQLAVKPEIILIDGNRKKEENGQFKRNEDGLPVQPDFPGYNQEYYNAIVRDTGDRLKMKF